jgi:hypothetical protein
MRFLLGGWTNLVGKPRKRRRGRPDACAAQRPARSAFFPDSDLAEIARAGVLRASNEQRTGWKCFLGWQLRPAVAEFMYDS